MQKHTRGPLSRHKPRWRHLEKRLIVGRNDVLELGPDMLAHFVYENRQLLSSHQMDKGRKVLGGQASLGGVVHHLHGLVQLLGAKDQLWSHGRGRLSGEGIREGENGASELLEHTVEAEIGRDVVQQLKDDLVLDSPVVAGWVGGLVRFCG